ncbi:ABCC2, partial [Symbiodinium necroappetens]
RPSSAPPGRAVGRSQWLIKFPGAPGSGPGAEMGKMDLWSNPPPFFSCPFCSRRVQVPKSLWPSDPGVMVRTGPRRGKGPEYDGGFHPEKRKIARVVSSTYRHGNRADFYLDGKKIALDSGRWAFHEQNRRGFNVVTLDPDSQQILSAMSYDTASGGNVAVSQLATDLNSLPEGRIVLVAVRGSGLQSLSGAAIRALRRVGATSMVSGGRSQEGYVLIGMKGGDAVAERRGHHVEVEGVLPRPPWQTPSISEVLRLGLRLQTSPTQSMLTTPYKALDDAQPETATTADPSYAPTVEKLRLRQLLRSVVLVASGFFRDKSSRLVAWSLACALLVMMLGFSLLQMWFLNTFREFQNALHDKDQQKFYSTLLLMFKVVLSIMPLLALRELLRGALALEWRRYLTSSLLSRYIGESRMYYRLKLLGKGLDNPDQRIAQDCGEFTDAILQFLALLVQNIMLILFQSSLLFKISPDLFYFVVVYSIVLNVLTFVVFGGPLTRLRRRILAQEASFRFGLVRVREHAESIAFYSGESFERGRCQHRFFNSLMDTLYRMLGVTVSFSIILAAATYVVRVAPFAVLAGKYFRGDIDFGAMMEAFSILSGLEDAFTTLVSQMSSITDMGAQAIRIQQIWDLVSDDSKDLADSPAISMERDAGEIQKESQEVPVLLQMQEVTLQTPSGHAVLVERLSFQLRQGESLLLCGRSGVGKSSLLRSIAGLWGRGSGVIRCCPQRETFFLPQETYLCLGTLRENATYPQEAGGASPRDDTIREALVKVNLDYLRDRYGLDKPVDFDAVLSGGERQRLGFARLLLRPNLKFAILDEATSALDRSNQSAMYENLQRHVKGFVSIGHSSSLEVLTRAVADTTAVSTVAAPSDPQDLGWYFLQQKQFLDDLKVCEDRHDAWNSKVFMQDEEIEKLKKQVRALEEERDGLRKDLKEAMRERDEWQVSALRVMSKREFRSSVEALEAARRRPLPP